MSLVLRKQGSQVDLHIYVLFYFVPSNEIRLCSTKDDQFKHCKATSKVLFNRNLSTFLLRDWPSSFGLSWQEYFWSSRIDTSEYHSQRSASQWCIFMWVTGLRRRYSWWQRSMTRPTSNSLPHRSTTRLLLSKSGAMHLLWVNSRLLRTRIKKRNWLKMKFNRKLIIIPNGKISIRSKVVS